MSEYQASYFMNMSETGSAIRDAVALPGLVEPEFRIGQNDGENRISNGSRDEIDAFSHRLDANCCQWLQIVLMSVTIAPLRFALFFLGNDRLKEIGIPHKSILSRKNFRD